MELLSSSRCGSSSTQSQCHSQPITRATRRILNQNFICSDTFNSFSILKTRHFSQTIFGSDQLKLGCYFPPEQQVNETELTTIKLNSQ